MTFDDLPDGLAVFLDANVFLCYFTAHPITGAACEKLLDRIDRGDLTGVTSSQVLGEVIHRLMAIEACGRFGWPGKGIAQRMRKHAVEIQQLTRHRQAVDEVAMMRVQVLPVLRQQVSVAVDVITQSGLLFGDALIVAMMRDQGLQHLASNDQDFDRITGLVRYMAQ